MSTARKRNDNIILWDPVTATKGAFTSIESLVHVYEPYSPEIASSSMFTNEASSIPVISHDKMLKVSQRCIPDDSWYEEDFTKLRHSRG